MALADIWTEKPQMKIALDNYIKQSKSGIVHFSALKNLSLAEAIMHEGRIRTFTDNAGNVIFFGFYGCNEINESVANCQHPNYCRILYDSGILFKGLNRTFGEKLTVQVRRAQGYNGFYDSIKPQFEKLSGNNYLTRMTNQEKAGRSDYPFVYLITDIDPANFKNTLSTALPYIVGGVAALLAITGVGAVASAGILLAVKAISTTVEKFAKTGVLTLNDAINVTAQIAPTLIGDKDSALGITANDLQTYVKQGGELYSAIARKDYISAAQTLGVGLDNNETVSEILDSLKKSDVVQYAKQIGEPIEAAEKLINSLQATEMVKSLLLDGEKILEQARVFNNPFVVPEVQQYLITAVAATGLVSLDPMTDLKQLASAVPGATTAIKAITDNTNLSTGEFKALIDLAQGELEDETQIAGLLAEAMIERAKNYIGKTFVLPSNIPAYLQGEIAKRIMEQVKGVKVITVANESVRHNEFYLEFI